MADRGSTGQPDRGELAIPFGDYVLRKLVGAGGMASVYEAVDAAGRVVAIKVLREVRNSERFLREGRTVAKLRHPGILPVHATGEADGKAFLVFPLVPNARTLDSALAQATQAQRLSWLAEVADALAYAHSEGVVHRDVKPENVLLSEGGSCLLADFGVALASEQTRLTQTGGMVGTPSFMAPEQLNGNRKLQGPATDVWSLGVTLYLMLTEQLPFPANNALELFSQVQAGAPRVTSGPEQIRRLCGLALSREPQGRPSAEVFRDALLAHLRGDQPELPRAPRSRRWQGAALGLTAAVVLLGVALNLPSDSPAEAPPPSGTEPPRQAQVVPTEPELVQPPSAEGASTIERARASWLAGAFETAEAELSLYPTEDAQEHADEARVELYTSWLKNDLTLKGLLNAAVVEELELLLDAIRPPPRRQLTVSLLELAHAGSGLSAADRETVFQLAANASPDPLPVDLARARADLNEERLDSARERLRAHVTRKPVDSHALALWGELLCLEGDLPAAQVAIDAALAATPQLSAGWRARALLHEAEGEFAAGLTAIERAWDLDEKVAEVLVVRSRLRLRTGDVQSAETDAQSAVNLLGTVPAWRALAEAHEANKDWQGAGHAWARVKESDPTQLETWVRRLRAQRLAKNFHGAQGSLNDALRRFPGEPALLLERALLLEDQGKAREARVLLVELANRKPVFLPVLRLLAKRSLTWSSGWHDGQAALQLCSMILAELPNDPLAWQQRAVAYGRLNDWERARRAGERACELDPSSVHAASTLGHALSKLGQHAASLKVLNRGVELDPKHIFVRFNRADAFRGLGRYPEAVEDLEFFTARNTTNYHAWWRLADSLSNTGEAARAERAFAQALTSLDPSKDPWFAHYHLGLHRERSGDLDGARSALRKAAELTRNPERRADCHETLTRLGELMPAPR